MVASATRLTEAIPELSFVTGLAEKVPTTPETDIVNAVEAWLEDMLIV